MRTVELSSHEDRSLRLTVHITDLLANSRWNVFGGHFMAPYPRKPVTKYWRVICRTDLVIPRAGNRIFRVFTTILKDKSSVFADMFSFPQPSVPGDVETIGGVPVVNMHDDPKELEVFLRAIFDAKPKETLLLQCFILLINMMFTSFVVVHWNICPQCSEDYHDGSTASYTFHSFVDGVLKTIKVLVEVDALWMLPDAYYSLFRPGLRAILSAGASWDGLGKSEKTNRLRLFSHSVQLQPCTTSLSFLSLSSIEDSPCKDPRICNRARLTAIRTHPWAGNYDLLDAWDENDWHALEFEGLCEKCLKEAKGLYKRAKQKFWDELPQLFDLPDWATLKQMRDAVMA
ncbi:hypothetical protein B0H14DRAFT_2642445 [Mycena olivaceomarginata]|nr:hypothetical protein B0H14DRAFT_2642445 [Mycena olivaceomarginata]